jgi:hypothetical protein
MERAKRGLAGPQSLAETRTRLQAPVAPACNLLPTNAGRTGA